MHLLAKPGCNYLEQDDFIPFLQVRAAALAGRGWASLWGGYSALMQAGTLEFPVAVGGRGFKGKRRLIYSGLEGRARECCHSLKTGLWLF